MTHVSLLPPPCDELTTSDPRRRATRVSPPGTDPEGIVTGPDNAIWIAEKGSNKIARFRPSTHAFKEFAVPTANLTRPERPAAAARSRATSIEPECESNPKNRVFGNASAIRIVEAP